MSSTWQNTGTIARSSTEVNYLLAMIPALTIENLSKVYDNGFEALKGISFKVEQGDFFALLGPNGAGKSTTIGIICSLVAKSGGRVRIFDVDIDDDFPAAKRHIGIVPQEFNFNQFEKALDIVVNQAGYYGLPPALARERAEKYLRELGIWEQRDVPSRMLSGGMKRRLMIARSLIHEPRLLRQLSREVFILDCVEDLPEAVAIEGFIVRRVDDHSLEVEVQKGQHLNAVFSALGAAGIHVSSMRNRANRLEEMFVNLVEGAA